MWALCFLFTDFFSFLLEALKNLLFSSGSGSVLLEELCNSSMLPEFSIAEFGSRFTSAPTDTMLSDVFGALVTPTGVLKRSLTGVDAT